MFKSNNNHFCSFMRRAFCTAFLCPVPIERYVLGVSIAFRFTTQGSSPQFQRFLATSIYLTVPLNSFLFLFSIFFLSILTSLLYCSLMTLPYSTAQLFIYPWSCPLQGWAVNVPTQIQFITAFF